MAVLFNEKQAATSSLSHLVRDIKNNKVVVLPGILHLQQLECKDEQVDALIEIYIYLQSTADAYDAAPEDNKRVKVWDTAEWRQKWRMVSKGCEVLEGMTGYVLGIMVAEMLRDANRAQRAKEATSWSLVRVCLEASLHDTLCVLGAILGSCILGVAVGVAMVRLLHS